MSISVLADQQQHKETEPPNYRSVDIGEKSCDGCCHALSYDEDRLLHCFKHSKRVDYFRVCDDQEE